MLNQHNAFKSVIQAGTLPSDTKKKFKQTQMYILVEELKKIWKDQLGPDEPILAMVPMTNEENSAIFTTGIMGMSYARTEKARQYVNTFYDLRSNRLLLFTPKKIIFFVVLDFLEEGQYYTYPYELIESIHLEAYKIGIFGPNNNKNVIEMAKKGATNFYMLDFESQDHYFTEMFNQKDALTLLKVFKEVPALKNKVNKYAGVFRKRRWDYFFGNPLFSLKLAGWANIGWFVLLGLFLLALLLAFFH
ncbi:hypothetical protein [Enterococcus timonensis]|uniref:hypothetical protein n=1 Tax=Enterococcus timonensis TaxID=1852364 RepID=UPI0008DA80BE|nr:hypothetical protein [Enterococcus timonensis]